MKIETAMDVLNATIVQAQGQLMEVAIMLDKSNIDRSILNKIRDALSNAEYESRNIPMIMPDIEIY